MKVVTLLIVCFLLSACASKPIINKNLVVTPYKIVLIPHLKGDTANYVYKKFMEAFATHPDIQFIGHDRIFEASKALGLDANIHSASISNIRAIAELLNAQGMLLGQVKSGAMSISSSLQIYSSIQLDLIDISSGETVASEIVDEEMTLRERGSSLKTATNKIVSQYESIFSRL